MAIVIVNVFLALVTRQAWCCFMCSVIQYSRQPHQVDITIQLIFSDEELGFSCYITLPKPQGHGAGAGGSGGQGQHQENQVLKFPCGVETLS